jgi:hypothetical protein
VREPRTLEIALAAGTPVLSKAGPAPLLSGIDAAPVFPKEHSPSGGCSCDRAAARVRIRAAAAIGGSSYKKNF